MSVNNKKIYCLVENFKELLTDIIDTTKLDFIQNDEERPDFIIVDTVDDLAALSSTHEKTSIIILTELEEIPRNISHFNVFFSGKENFINIFNQLLFLHFVNNETCLAFDSLIPKDTKEINKFRLLSKNKIGHYSDVLVFEGDKKKYESNKIRNAFTNLIEHLEKYFTHASFDVSFFVDDEIFICQLQCHLDVEILEKLSAEFGPDNSTSFKAIQLNSNFMSLDMINETNQAVFTIGWSSSNQDGFSFMRYQSVLGENKSGLSASGTETLLGHNLEKSIGENHDEDLIVNDRLKEIISIHIDKKLASEEEGEYHKKLKERCKKIIAQVFVEFSIKEKEHLLNVLGDFDKKVLELFALDKFESLYDWRVSQSAGFLSRILSKYLDMKKIKNSLVQKEVTRVKSKKDETLKSMFDFNKKFKNLGQQEKINKLVEEISQNSDLDLALIKSLIEECLANTEKANEIVNKEVIDEGEIESLKAEINQKNALIDSFEEFVKQGLEKGLIKSELQDEMNNLFKESHESKPHFTDEMLEKNELQKEIDRIQKELHGKDLLVDRLMEKNKEDLRLKEEEVAKLQNKLRIQASLPKNQEDLNNEMARSSHPSKNKNNDLVDSLTARNKKIERELIEQKGKYEQEITLLKKTNQLQGQKMNAMQRNDKSADYISKLKTSEEKAAKYVLKIKELEHKLNMSSKLFEQTKKKAANSSGKNDPKLKHKAMQLEKNNARLEKENLKSQKSLAANKKELAKLKQDFMVERNKNEALQREIEKAKKKAA